MIFFVDEDSGAFDAWHAELRLRSFDVCPLWNANQAFSTLCDVAPERVDLVVIDVMLAVADISDDRFSTGRTDDYLETGLCLLEDLVQHNPHVFPERAVLLTNTVNDRTFRAAKASSLRFNVPLWKKAKINSPVHFGDEVEKRIRACA